LVEKYTQHHPQQNNLCISLSFEWYTVPLVGISHIVDMTCAGRAGTRPIAATGILYAASPDKEQTGLVFAHL
jgi:hypothetical protein